MKNTTVDLPKLQEFKKKLSAFLKEFEDENDATIVQLDVYYQSVETLGDRKERPIRSDIFVKIDDGEIKLIF